MKFEKLNGQNNEPYYMNNIIWTIRYGPKNEAYHTHTWWKYEGWWKYDIMSIDD